jgi:hypothetical protein
VDYYGSFLGIQDKFKMNLADDLEYVSSYEFFKNNLGKLFKVNTEGKHEYINYNSRANKLKLNISGSDEKLDEIVCIDDVISISDEIGATELVYENDKMNPNNKSSSSSGSSNNSEMNYSTEDEEEDENEEEEWETESETEDDVSFEQDDDYISAFINNFPVQMICLEKCDGTLDELFAKKQVDAKTGASILMQIVMTLICLQKTFRFTHNDLHTNNVMYVNTDVEFLYYKFENITYKVPTYGRIFKIIDFGRAIYKFQGKQFCSDSFSPGGDAATQYNFEPFFNEKKARLEPNFSFDLSRLGTSIFDFVIQEDDEEKMDDFQKTIFRWCKDDNGKNILYKKNGDDRYPNFKLYKMIARTVHNHSPEEQLKFKFFNQYKVKGASDAEKVINIDTLPCYI